MEPENQVKVKICYSEKIDLWRNMALKEEISKLKTNLHAHEYNDKELEGRISNNSSEENEDLLEKANEVQNIHQRAAEKIDEILEKYESAIEDGSLVEDNTMHGNYREEFHEYKGLRDNYFEKKGEFHELLDNKANIDFQKT